MNPPVPPRPPVSPLQGALADALADALGRCLLAHPPAADGPPPGSHPAGAPVTAWRVPPGTASRSAATQLAAAQASTPATRERFALLYARCLAHYREQLRHAEREDDAGAALGCFMAACLQGLQGHPVTAERWQGVCDWIEAWVDADAAWQAAPPEDQRDFFERMAILAAAIGEWSVQASRQGPEAIQAAQTMAAQHLQQQLGLSAGAFLRAMRHQGLVPGYAADPSWGDAELPTVPAFGV